MGKINQLSFAVANLIAAGEVVDRPASVVKELLENSIDAGADNIVVEIHRGGVLHIRVSDNGCGISKDDLPIAIKRHATSKISGAEDLDSIATLGFRGEALAAISAVSDVKILSKTKDSDVGYLLSSCAGGEVEVCEVGCADGTTVIVENLFYNVPARRKFLKKDVTEAMAVSAVVEKIALSRPGISFTYIIDGQRKFETAGDGKIKNTVYAVLGRDFAAKLIELNSSYGEIRIYGFVGRSDNCRANRNMQNFFINGRFVKSKTACAGIEQAFSSYMAESRFPVCVMFIDISPAAVDVNVHPAKLEVKFSNEKAVFEAVYYSVKTALENAIDKSAFEMPKNEKHTKTEIYTYSNRSENANISSLRPATNAFAPIRDKNNVSEQQTLYGYGDSFRLKNYTVSDSKFHVSNIIEKEVQADEKDVSVSSINTDHEEKNATITENEEKQNENALFDRSSFLSEIKISLNTLDNTVYTTEEKTAEKAEAIDLQSDVDLVQTAPYRIIGVCFNTYILVEQENVLLIIDKHAAHERIIFERLKKNLKKVTHMSQMLMIPIYHKLSHDEFSAAMEYRDDIMATGFDFSLVEDDFMVEITAIPDMLDTDNSSDLFVSMLGSIADNTGDVKLARDAIYEKALYQASCKAALKGGRNDAEENIKWICDTLMSIPDIKVCPHGRPVITELGKKYIDRQFDRIK